MSKKSSKVTDQSRPPCIVTPASVARASRARQPTKNFSGLFRGKFPSLKNGRMIHWESLLERDAIMLLEFSPGVTAFREQPFSTYYYHQGRMPRYTPDFEVTFRCGRVALIEVKPSCKLQLEKEQKRLAAIRSHFETRGLTFTLLDENQIRRNPLFGNLRHLISHRMPQLSETEAHRFVALLGSVKPSTFEGAVRALGSESTFWRLVALEKISINLSEAVRPGTFYTINGEDGQDEKVYF